MAPRIRSPLLATLVVAASLSGCGSGGAAGSQVPARAVPATAQAPPSIQGAWRVVELAVRVPGQAWTVRPGPQAGLYVFSARHYSYVYVPGDKPRFVFKDANRPTEAEKAGAYDSFIAGAGSYTFDGVTLALKADLRKNPNEMTGENWSWQAEASGDTLRLVFADPPFLPGREWRTVLVRIE